MVILNLKTENVCARKSFGLLAAVDQGRGAQHNASQRLNWEQFECLVLLVLKASGSSAPDVGELQHVVMGMVSAMLSPGDHNATKEMMTCFPKTAS